MLLLLLLQTLLTRALAVLKEQYHPLWSWELGYVLAQKQCPHRSRPSAPAAAQATARGWAGWRGSAWTQKLSVSARCLAKESDVHPATHLLPVGQAVAMVAATVMAVGVELGPAKGVAGSRHAP